MTDLSLNWKPTGVPHTEYAIVSQIWVGLYESPSDKSTWISLAAAPGDEIRHYPQTPKKFPDRTGAEFWALDTVRLILKAREEPIMNGGQNEMPNPPAPPEGGNNPATPGEHVQNPSDPASPGNDKSESQPQPDDPELVVPRSDFVDDEPGDEDEVEDECDDEDFGSEDDDLEED